MPIALILEPQGGYILRHKSPPWLWFCRCWWRYCCFGVWVGRLLLLPPSSTCCQSQLQVEVFCQCSLLVAWASAPLLATELYCWFSLSVGSYVAIVFRLSNLHLHHQLLLNSVHPVQLMNLKKRSLNNFSIYEGLLIQTSEQAVSESMVYLLSECLFLLQHGHLDVFLLHLFPSPNPRRSIGLLPWTVCLQKIEVSDVSTLSSEVSESFSFIFGVFCASQTRMAKSSTWYDDAFNLHQLGEWVSKDIIINVLHFYGYMQCTI